MALKLEQLNDEKLRREIEYAKEEINKEKEIEMDTTKQTELLEDLILRRNAIESVADSYESISERQMDRLIELEYKISKLKKQLT